MPRKLSIVSAVGLVIGLSAIAQACNVPVFRFALERWRPDAYRVVLLHRGPLTAAEREIITPLELQQGDSLANFAFRTIDVVDLETPTEDNAADRELLESLDAAELPRLIVQYPEASQIAAPAWSAPLDHESVAGLIDSPVRQELVRRLASGQTAVWLLVESGDAEKDSAAAALLDEELKRLEEDLQLPELGASPDDELLANLPLEVRFSVLRVPHADAPEAALVSMLLHSEPDLAGRSEAMIFPVFGRGRALFPLVGAGITSENVIDYATFLVGPCSCQVKEQNPGFDLFLAADWDGLLAEAGVPAEAIAAAEQNPEDMQPVLVPIPGGSREMVVAEPTNTSHSSAESAPASRGWTIFGVAVASVLLVVSLIAAAARVGERPR
jgi:hypothetical protein